MTVKETYIIRIERPKDVSITEMKAYIKTAISRWAGQYHPGHPLFFSTLFWRVDSSFLPCISLVHK